MKELVTPNSSLPGRERLRSAATMNQSCPRVGSGRVTILPKFGGSGRVGSALRIFQFFTYYFLVPKSI